MKAQVSTEFLVMIMAGTMMIISFMYIYSALYQDNLSDKKRILAEDYGYGLQNEFIMASEASSGYTRNFVVPGTLEGFSYEATILENTLIINYTENTFYLKIPNVTGILKKGNNIIQKNEGVICLNC